MARSGSSVTSLKTSFDCEDAMSDRTIEAMLASPPDREELVVQLFLRDGVQWGEVFREGGEYWIDLYRSQHEAPMRLPLGEMISALTQSVEKLRQRLETT
jgi:hypothetical protein